MMSPVSIHIVQVYNEYINIAFPNFTFACVIILNLARSKIPIANLKLFPVPLKHYCIIPSAQLFLQVFKFEARCYYIGRGRALSISLYYEEQRVIREKINQKY